MAYRRKGYRKSYGGRKKVAGSVARRVSRRAYRGALRMSKRKLARVYATKVGQTAFRATKTLGGRRARKYGNRRAGRRMKMRRY